MRWNGGLPLAPCAFARGPSKQRMLQMMVPLFAKQPDQLGLDRGSPPQSLAPTEAGCSGTAGGSGGGGKPAMPPAKHQIPSPS